MPYIADRGRFLPEIFLISENSGIVWLCMLFYVLSSMRESTFFVPVWTTGKKITVPGEASD